MYFFKALSPILLASAAAASVPLGGHQFPLGSSNKDVNVLDFDVPGDNPLQFCADPADYKVEITSVDLDPNPPEAGKTLKIVAKGDVKEKVEKGSYVDITVKYGLIKILTLKEDLCDQMKNIDKECPVDKGEIAVEKSVDLPSRIPPGKYTVLASAFSKDDVQLTCLEATIQFS